MTFSLHILPVHTGINCLGVDTEHNSVLLDSPVNDHLGKKIASKSYIFWQDHFQGIFLAGSLPGPFFVGRINDNFWGNFSWHDHCQGNFFGRIIAKATIFCRIIARATCFGRIIVRATIFSESVAKATTHLAGQESRWHILL